MLQSMKRRLQSLSLGSQLFTALVALLFITVLLPGLLLTYWVRRNLEEHLLQDRQLIAQGITVPIQSFLDEQYDELQLAIDFQASSPVQQAALQQGMALSLARNPNLLEIVLVSEAGQVISQASADNESLLTATAFSLRQSRWFLEALQGNSYVSTLYTSPQSQPYVIISQPSHQVAYENSILAARVDASFLKESIQYLHLEPYDRVYVVDQNQYLVADSETLVTSEGFRMPRALQDKTHPFTGRYINDQQPVLGATAQIRNTSWLVVVEIPEERALAPMAQLMQLLIGVLLYATVLTIGLWWLISRYIMEPLQALTAVASNLDLSLSPAIPIRYHEMTNLAAAFEQMRTVIIERERNLRTANDIQRIRSQELADLSRRIIAVEEEERRRFSRELHDGMGQLLAALKMNLDVAQRLDDPVRIKTLLLDASHIAEQAIDETHTISQDLRPTVLDDLGLDAAMQWYIDQFQERYQIPISHELGKAEIPALNAECEITTYRFVQEALNNVRKHAQATQVTIQVRQQVNYLMLAVKDNGVGFDPKAPDSDNSRLHLGLTGLQERLVLIGGELVIHSNLGQGTTLVALVPISGG
jgi:signal transduction histidine kinase